MDQFIFVISVTDVFAQVKCCIISQRKVQHTQNYRKITVIDNNFYICRTC